MTGLTQIPNIEPDVLKALLDYKQRLQAHFGKTFKGIYLFGSRAKGFHRPDSDADIAVILDTDIRLVPMLTELAEVNLAIWEQYHLDIQAWPFRYGSLEDPDASWAPPISRTILCEGIPF